MNPIPSVCVEDSLNPRDDLVAAFVEGGFAAQRKPVQAEAIFRAYHENDRIRTDLEAYSSLFQYPRTDYLAHWERHGSPAGYAGPAACSRLVWDIDNKNDLDAALADTRKLVRYLRERYGESGLALYFSGSKGFHITLVAPLDSFRSRPYRSP